MAQQGGFNGRARTSSASARIALMTATAWSQSGTIIEAVGSLSLALIRPNRSADIGAACGESQERAHCRLC
jgi:hypothetical protein